MKNRPFWHRLGFALAGFSAALKRERSFRTQVVIGLCAFAVLAFLRPAAVWWALCILSAGAVLTAELINTSLEETLDRLHPQQHPSVQIAKDCAAAAVLCASIAATCIGVLTVLVTIGVIG
ncbi:MAG: diacylglycerol kinase [Pseudomonadales bacterium]|nr:diacylglycerol kinase [Pseudomonadales bacterium]